MRATSHTRFRAKSVSHQPEWVVGLLICLAAFWLHIYFLVHAGGFWRDEVNLINLATGHSLDDMSKDSFPILMPLLVRAWTVVGLGQNDLSIRILGMLIGLLLPAALWLAVWKIEHRPPMLGLVLLALNSPVIIFGDSLRAYGLGSLMVLLTVAAACLFIKNPTWPRTAWLAALATLSVQALYQNSLIVAAICFGAWAVCWREKNAPAALKILSVAIISAASLLPYWSRIAAMPDGSAALRTGFQPEYIFINLDNALGIPMVQYLWVWEFMAVAVIAGALAAIFQRRQVSAGEPSLNLPLFSASTLVAAVVVVSGFMWFAVWPKSRWYFLPLAVLMLLCLDSDRIFSRLFPSATAGVKPQMSSSSASGGKGKNLQLFAGVTLLTAIATFAGFLRYAELITEPWYFFPLMALTAICIEISLPQGRHMRMAILGFAILTFVIGIRSDIGDLTWRFSNIDLVAQQVAAKAGPDDFIVVAPWYCGITFDYYYKGTTPWNTLPPLKDHSIHRYDLVKEQMQTRDAIQPLLAQMAATLQAGHRVWVVGRFGIPAPNKPPPADLPPPPLKYSNWSDQPYNRNWTAQATEFLSTHSRTFQQVYYSTNISVNFTEDVQLHLAQGWQNSPTNHAQ